MAELLLQYGYLIIFGWMLLDYLGLPLPGEPALLLAGAFSASSAQLGSVIVLATAGVLLADHLWFVVARTRGSRLLGRHQTILNVNRFGLLALVLVFVVAKYIAGVRVLLAPLSGITQVPYLRFLTADLAGTLLWTGGLSGLGYALKAEVSQAVRLLHPSQPLILLGLLATAALLFTLWVRWRGRGRLVEDRHA
ncbi:MAG: VTT domain-containing protein [Deltaproteobacteria bacterium]|nr:VTT domain-containing protein [Deltaproteobacteria bacterium]